MWLSKHSEFIEESNPKMEMYLIYSKVSKPPGKHKSLPSSS